MGTSVIVGDDYACGSNDGDAAGLFCVCHLVFPFESRGVCSRYIFIGRGPNNKENPRYTEWTAKWATRCICETRSLDWGLRVAIGAACAALFSLPIMHEKTDQHPMPNAKSEAVYRGVPLPLIAGLQTTQVTGNFRARCTRSPKFEAPS